MREKHKEEKYLELRAQLDGEAFKFFLERVFKDGMSDEDVNDFDNVKTALIVLLVKI